MTAKSSLSMDFRNSFGDALLDTPWGKIELTYPWAKNFFQEHQLDVPQQTESITHWLAILDTKDFEDKALTCEALASGFTCFIERQVSSEKVPSQLQKLSIKGGRSKTASPETIELTVHTGDVVCIVGPTGSGKSRLLCDIECLAQDDTPTHRTILIDDRIPSDAERFLASDKLVAQLSQSMQYVLDLGVAEFLGIHAQSRHLQPGEDTILEIIERANRLCGEPFDGETPLCLLSGGQSRALMIADVALLSQSPIILIDELENAGVDGQAALDLLITEGKIVFIATHDPALMLHGSHRIIMRDGTMSKVLERSAFETEQLVFLNTLNRNIERLRNHLRLGNQVDVPLDKYLSREVVSDD